MYFFRLRVVTFEPSSLYKIVQRSEFVFRGTCELSASNGRAIE